MSNIGTFLNRLPPQDIEAERCVLGGILLANESIDDVTGIIKTGHFYVDAHRRLFHAMSEMYQSGHRGIDVVTLRDELTRRGELDLIGGVPYLMQLMEVVPNAFNAAYYAGLVKECWARREIINAATAAIEAAHIGHVESADTLATVEAKFRAIDTGDGTGLVDMRETMQAALDVLVDRMANDTPPDIGLSTGWRCLDDLVTGFKAGWMIVIAARPGVGKTGIVGAITTATVKSREAVLFFSLEMSGSELALRMLSSEARVKSDTIKQGRPDEIEMYELSNAVNAMQDWPLTINERANITMAEVCAMIRRSITRQRIKLVVIDYLQLVQADDRKQPREQQIADMTRKLKVTAKECGVPIILLCQLNREAAKRKDQRPQLSDLRESGSIEQDADVVMLLHRPDMIDPDDRAGEVDVIVAKNRHGPIGTATLTFDKSIMRYRDAGEFEKPSEEF